MIGDCRIAPVLACPLPEDQANCVLQDKGPTMVEDVERAIGSPCGLLGEEFSQDAVAEDWGCPDSRNH